jgi:glycosyltransferase involved in cell wall biosynthesis
LKPSVVVTTYNNPGAIKRVLEGLAYQVAMPFEVIVADDGSGDETAEVVNGFMKTSPFSLLHVWHEDRGFRAAGIRNKAILRSTGDYIVFLDGDCIPNRYFVSDHMRLAEKGTFLQGKRVIVGKQASGYITSSSVNSCASLTWLALSGQISNKRHVIRMPVLFALKNRKMRGIKTCNMGVYREDVLAVNGFNESFVGWGREDSEFAARLYKYGLMRKEHSYMAICYHLWHPENPREHLARNDELLKNAIAQDDYRCTEGIDKTVPRDTMQQP